MNAKGLTPILNVSDITESFTWFEKLGWQKCWAWGEPPTFGAVDSGCFQIFLCEGGKAAAGKAIIKRPLAKTAAKPVTRACGCLFGWTTSMPSTRNASNWVWMLLGLRRICRGMSARCTCAIRTDTFSESAAESKSRNKFCLIFPFWSRP